MVEVTKDNQLQIGFAGYLCIQRKRLSDGKSRHQQHEEDFHDTFCCVHAFPDQETWDTMISQRSEGTSSFGRGQYTQTSIIKGCGVHPEHDELRVAV